MSAPQKKRSKQDLYRAIPAEVAFRSLAPEKSADGSVVCICPACNERTLVAGSGVSAGSAKCKCKYRVTYWDHIQKEESLDNKAMWARLVQLADSGPASQACGRSEESPESRTSHDGGSGRQAGTLRGGVGGSIEQSSDGREIADASTIEKVCRLFLAIGTKCIDAGTDYSARARAFLQAGGFNPSEYRAMEVCVHPGTEYMRRFCKNQHINVQILKDVGLITDIDLQGYLAVPWRNAAGGLTGFVMVQPVIGAGFSDTTATYAGQSHLFFCDASRPHLTATGTALVMGSVLDVMYLRVNDIQNAIAFPHWPPSTEALNALRDCKVHEVVLCLQLSSRQEREMTNLFASAGLTVAFLDMPGDAAPSEYLRQNGRASFLKVLKRHTTAWIKIVRHIVSEVESSHNGQLGVVGRKEVIRQVEQFVGEIPEQIFPEVVRRLATDLGISAKEVKHLLAEASQIQAVSEGDDEPLCDDQIAEEEGAGEECCDAGCMNADEGAAKPIQQTSFSAGHEDGADRLIAILDVMETALTNNQWLYVQDVAVDSFYNYPFPKGPWGISLRQFFKDVQSKSRRFDKVGVGNLLRMIRRGYKEYQAAGGG